MPRDAPVTPPARQTTPPDAVGEWLLHFPDGGSWRFVIEREDQLPVAREFHHPACEWEGPFPFGESPPPVEAGDVFREPVRFTEEICDAP